MSHDTVRHTLTRAEAVEMIRKAPTGTKFAVHLHFDLPISDDPEHVFSSAGRGYVNISRKDAMRIAQDMFSDLREEQGARVPFGVTTYTGYSGTSVTYWLG